MKLWHQKITQYPSGTIISVSIPSVLPDHFESQAARQHHICPGSRAMNYVRYDNTLMKRQTSGQTDPGLFTSGNLQGFIADLCIQRIPVCSEKPVELYFADYRRQLFIRTGSLLIKITPDRIVENINLLRHQQIVNSQRQQKNKDDQKTHPVAI